jgi:hypothetical protein
MRVQRTSGLVVRLGATVAGLAMVAAAAGAQSPAAATGDARWRAFSGCWAPGSDSMTPLAENAPVVCLAPGEGGSVWMVAVAEGKVVAREAVVATGARVANERDGCTGWEQATWSADGNRLYRRGEHTCANGVKRVTQGVFAIGPAGEWLDIRGAGTGASAGVIAIRYRPTSVPAGLPAEIAAVIPRNTPAMFDARAFAAVPLEFDDVVEASKQLEAPVLSTLLVERGQGFDLDAKKLVALADKGVPGRVIDAMVALSYPRVFAINRNGATADRRLPAQGEQVASTGRTIPVYVDAFGWSPYGYGYGGYGYGRYGYSPYGLGYGGYGYGGYGYGGYYGGGPVIVVRPPDDGTASGGHGRAVNGRGYTRGSGSDATPRSSGDGFGGRSSSGGSSAGSSGGSSAGSSGGSSGGGRTAKPKDP